MLLQLPDFDPLNSMRYLLKAYTGTRYKKEVGKKKGMNLGNRILF